MTRCITINFREHPESYSQSVIQAASQLSNVVGALSMTLSTNVGRCTVHVLPIPTFSITRFYSNLHKPMQ